MAVILMARHGETDWNRQLRWQGQADRPLTHRGREQAYTLGKHLAAFELTAIYSSDLVRAFQTAEIVAKPRGLQVTRQVALREIDVGSWAGLTYSEIARDHPEGFDIWRTGDPGWAGGESYEDLAERVIGAIVGIATRHRDAQVLVISHEDAIATIAARACGRDLRAYFRDKAIEELNARSRRRFAHCNGDVAQVVVEAGSVVGYQRLFKAQGEYEL